MVVAVSAEPGWAVCLPVQGARIQVACAVVSVIMHTCVCSVSLWSTCMYMHIGVYMYSFVYDGLHTHTCKSCVHMCMVSIWCLCVSRCMH